MLKWIKTDTSLERFSKIELTTPGKLVKVGTLPIYRILINNTILVWPTTSEQIKREKLEDIYNFILKEFIETNRDIVHIEYIQDRIQEEYYDNN